MSEKQSYRDADDMPTERAVLEREWKAMRLALSMPRTPIRVDLIQCLKCQQFWTGPVDGECPHCNPMNAAAQAAQPEAVGWKRVPVEPTVQMAQALIDYKGDDEMQWPSHVSPNFALAAYRIMLAAAPTEAKPAQQDAVDAEAWLLTNADIGYWNVFRERQAACATMDEMERSGFLDNSLTPLVRAAISAKKGSQ